MYKHSIKYATFILGKHAYFVFIRNANIFPVNEGNAEMFFYNFIEENVQYCNHSQIILAQCFINFHGTIHNKSATTYLISNNFN